MLPDSLTGKIVFHTVPCMSQMIRMWSSFTYVSYFQVGRWLPCVLHARLRESRFRTGLIVSTGIRCS